MDVSPQPEPYPACDPCPPAHRRIDQTLARLGSVTTTLDPGRVARTMLTMVAVLAAMHIAQLIAYFYIGDADVFDFVLVLDFDVEGNLPSMYSSAAIMFCAVLLAAIAGVNRDAQAPWRHHWLGLAWIFAYLAFDEASAVHERIGNFVAAHIDASGVLFFPWVIPYGVALCVFVIIYSRFLLNLPAQTAVRFVIAGALFVGGALGLELLGAREAQAFGTEALRYNVLSTLEELCEMLAVVVFAHALLCHRAAEIRARLTDTRPTRAGGIATVTPARQ